MVEPDGCQKTEWLTTPITDLFSQVSDLDSVKIQLKAFNKPNKVLNVQFSELHDCRQSGVPLSPSNQTCSPSISSVAEPGCLLYELQLGTIVSGI